MTENGLSPAHYPNGSADSAPLHTLCQQLNYQVEAFLAEDFKEEILRNTQLQCRHSLDIIHEALDRYP